MTSRDFAKVEIESQAWDFHDGSSGFILWTVEISWWLVELFMITGRDFHNDSSRFLWWTVENFMMTGRVFHDERSRFS